MSIVSISWDDGHEDRRIIDAADRRGVGGMTFYPTFLGGKDLSMYVGHEIGNHTFTHADLSTIPPRAIESELWRASMFIQLHTGKTPTSLAYPFGSHDSKVVEIARQCGFLMARTISRGGGHDAFHLHPDSTYKHPDFWRLYEEAREAGRPFVAYAHSHSVSDADVAFLLDRLVADEASFMTHTAVFQLLHPALL